jgi:hypothetical protein
MSEDLVMGMCKDCWEDYALDNNLTGGVIPIDKKPLDKNEDYT